MSGNRIFHMKILSLVVIMRDSPLHEQGNMTLWESYSKKKGLVSIILLLNANTLKKNTSDKCDTN